jgi:hypothetical protein
MPKTISVVIKIDVPEGAPSYQLYVAEKLRGHADLLESDDRAASSGSVDGVSWAVEELIIL